MDEGAFVLNTSTFGIMDLEADISSSPDDLLYYLTDQGPDLLPFDSTHLFDFTAVPSLSSSASSSSSPASSPPSSFSFSSSPGSGCSPISSPSTCISPSNSSSGGSSPEGPRIDVEDHFVFGSWIESALGSTDAPTISPSQLQMGSHHVSLDLTQPQILSLSSNDDDEESPADSPPPARSTTAGKKDTRKRKRTKKSSDESLPQTAVTLPRDELLKLSSQELEEYAENLRKVRKLTAEEEKDLRRQRRLIKNRESAQLSRVRRREHMEVIEQQLQEVQNENARLKLQVESLTTENRQLKQHIASSSLAPAVAPPRSPLLSAMSANAPTEPEEPSPSLIKMVQGWTTLGKGATATAVKATYLFVILLSIGLFFNARYVHYGPGLGPFEMGHRGVGMGPIYQFPATDSSRTATVDVPPPSLASRKGLESSSSGSGSSYFERPMRLHRDILEVAGDADNMEMAEAVNPKKAAQLYVNKNRNYNSKIEPAEVFVDSEKVEMDVKWSRRETLPSSSSSAAYVHSSSSTTMSAMATGEYANKTILMCPTFSPVHWPGEEMSADAEEITFLLPASSASYIPASRLRTDYSASSASASFPVTAKQASGNVVQLTCKVVDARLTSLSSLLVQ